MLLTISRNNKISPNSVTPFELLEWAKEDIKITDKRAIGNAVGNIKRSIHCRIDEIIENTHAKYCSDWNKRCNTRTKLKVLKILNIKYTSIVTLLTEIRNNFEHLYKLPELNQVFGYLDTAEMWLKLSYSDYSFNKIAITKLQTTNFGISDGINGIKLTNCVINNKSDLDYLWDRKKEIHEIKNGQLSIIPMYTIGWENMLKYEAKYIKYSTTPDDEIKEYKLPARLLTTVYKKAIKKLVN